MRRRWVLPVVAVAMALITTLAVVGYLRRLQKQVAVEAPVAMETAVFATTHVAERKLIAATAVELREVPASAVHAAAARRIDEVVNRVAIAPIYPGEQVLTSKLAPVGISVGLSYVLPKDKRALTLAVNEVIGVAGFVFPGDRVDVVGTVRENGDEASFTKIVLQNVAVVALAQKVDQKPGEDPKVTTSATLALTPEQVETLAQIDNIGKVRLALRPYGVTDEVRTTGKTVQAALGRAPQAAPASAVKATANRVQKTVAKKRAPSAAAPAAPASRDRLTNIDLYRATTKSTVTVKEDGQ